MTIHLEGVTVLADDVATLAEFYELAFGWDVEVREDAYVAFGGQGVRVAIFSRPLMSGHTDQHPAYAVPFTGQAFELNLQCDSADEVERRYDQLIAARRPRRGDRRCGSGGSSPASSQTRKATSTRCSRTCDRRRRSCARTVVRQTGLFPHNADAEATR